MKKLCAIIKLNLKLCLLVGVYSTAVAANESGAELRIMFVGDSLTAGYGLNEERAYPQLLEQKLRAEAYPIDVINAGVSGDTSSGGLRRMNWQLKAKPHWVVIALGGNDMLRGIPPRETKKNLVELIGAFQKKGLQVFLFGMQAAANLGKEYEREFNSVFADVAEQRSVPFFDLFIRSVVKKPELNQDDGIHPNMKGHEVLAEDVYRFMIPYVRQACALKNGVGSCDQNQVLK